ncbi:polysaccharide deacetylase [Nitrosospira sp. NpAV]|uniref:polysaccharide deacetylase family protein n=1 Tax=Nitrosospira sp. NpAV TaxID=58133 RepID=UPI00059F862A|nr:polysaccharide deacetylase [Nitrosospira sp. NpAV]KIO49378.1 polysaccharide deacetylase [Nitrosospira sp. NpAV]
MMDVFLTVDVEIWCDGWDNIDAKFPGAFQRYIYGPTSRGNYGLPYQLDQLQEHGLTGVFFVETLFSTRFGLDPLSEIVGLVRERGQELQLHLHTEWVDESREPLLDNITGKKQLLRYFSLPEQTILIQAGAKLIELAGGQSVSAFRAGSFGFNRDTLRALAHNHIAFDSSYNASMLGRDSGVSPDVPLVEPIECEGVYEYPMTVFHGGAHSLRHAQVTACSYREMEGLLWQALESGHKAFVILSHNFELLNGSMNRPDDIVVARFRKLCTFLDRHRDCFRVRGFCGLTPDLAASQPAPLTSPMWKTGLRMLEQGLRRGFQ